MTAIWQPRSELLRESSLLIPRRSPCGSVRVNREHAIGRNVRHCTTNGKLDLASGTQIVPDSNALYDWRPDRKNWAFRHTNTSAVDLNGFQFSTKPSTLYGSHARTILVYAYHSSSDNKAKHVVSYGYNTSYQRFSFRAVPSGAVDYLRLEIESTGTTSTLALPNSDECVFGVAYDGGTGGFFWKDQSIDTSLSFSSAANTSTTKAVTIGQAAYTDAATYTCYDLRIYLVAVIDRFITHAEALSLSRDPFQFLIPA